MHICGDKLTNIDSDDLSPGRRQAIIWTNAGILLIGPLGTNLSEILTHWGWVTHMCVNTLTIIGSDNGLAPGRRQAIIWTNDGILLIGPLGTNFSVFLLKIYTFSFMKMHLKMSSGKWRPFCLGLNVLIEIHAFSFKKMHLKILSAKWWPFCLNLNMVNLKTLEFSPVNQIHIFQCMDKIFCVEFQRAPLKFHTQYFAHTLQDTIFILKNFKNSKT